MNIDWLAILSDILQYILAAVLPVLAGFVAWWLKVKIDEIKANMKPDWTWAVQLAAETAVKAAEQMKLAELIEDKKEYAFGIANSWLLGQGIEIDLAVLEAAIEAAVLEHFPRK